MLGCCSDRKASFVPSWDSRPPIRSASDDPTLLKPILYVITYGVGSLIPDKFSDCHYYTFLQEWASQFVSISRLNVINNATTERGPIATAEGGNCRLSLCESPI